MRSVRGASASTSRGSERRLRSRLTRALAVTALASLLSVGTINFFAARELLQEGSTEQLVDIAEGRANSIENGLERVLARTSTTAADRGVIDAVVDFEQAFAQLAERPLSDEEGAELDSFYEEEVLEPLSEIGLDATLADVEPAAAGRYVQYHYVVPRSTGAPVGASDDSTYRDAIEAHDDFLVGLVSEGGIDDILLLSVAGDVVYSARKFIDIGTNLESGPLETTALANAALVNLPRVRVGNAVVADYELYLPGGGDPALFVLAAVKDESEVVGAIAMRVSVDALNAITTANGDWESAGLGQGESYVVGADLTLLSESRRWIEDPEGFLDTVDDPLTATLIEAFGSPVGLQEVDTRPVRTALGGDTFTGSTSNYLGEKTFSYARQLTVEGLRWVVVADQPVSEVRAPLWTYLRRLGLVVLILLPIAALLGYFLADRLTRSIVPVVQMAGSVAAGERNLAVPDLGGNEVGDLARQLERMARELGEQERALEAEFEERRELLRSVLPARLVAMSGEVDDMGEAIDLGTVISVLVHVDANDTDNEDDATALGELGAVMERLAEELDIERVRTAADRSLFVAGVGRPEDGAAEAVRFVEEIIAHVRDVDHDNEAGDITIFAGLATGTVATGVLERGSLTFSVWGEPVRRAMAIAALSTSNEILLDESTAKSLGQASEVHRTDDVVALDGEPMTLFSLDSQQV